MLKFFIVIIFFLVALSLFLAMSVGIAFCLVWLLPPISFEIAVLIGVVSLGIIFYGFFKVMHLVSIVPTVPISTVDDYVIEEVYHERSGDEFMPRRSTRSNKRKR